MIKPTLTVLAACLMGASCTSGHIEDPIQPAGTALDSAPPAPEFQGLTDWINSKPLTLAQLRGRVVLVEFWTYDCINCIHVIPHVKQWHERYKDDGLAVIGVHTPEYDHERIPANVRKAVERFGIGYPVALDNDHRTWTAYENRYWPAMYLIDQDGRIVYRHFGEGDYEQTEARIRALLGKA
jgi:thiol-disulfide isomerase/thioredoxin